MVLRLIVDKTGQPRDIQIVRPAGGGLDEAAFEAVSRWRFAPGTRNAEPVAVRMDVETSFLLY